MGMGTIRIFDPVSKPREQREKLAPRVSTISGKSFGIISNGWRSFDVMAARYAELAIEKHEARESVYRKNPSAASATPTAAMDAIAGTDAAIVGIGH